MNQIQNFMKKQSLKRFKIPKSEINREKLGKKTKESDNQFSLVRWMVKAESFWVGIAMGATIIGIIIVGLDLGKNLSEKQKINQGKEKVLSEVKFWQEVSQKYKGYRDAYFKLALLEYQLGNTEKSRTYLKEVYSLDPNFEKGRELEKLLNANVSE